MAYIIVIDKGIGEQSKLEIQEVIRQLKSDFFLNTQDISELGFQVIIYRNPSLLPHLG